MSEPTREDIDATPGLVALEFGTSWCGFCQSARPYIDRALAEHPNVRHISVEDGRGKRLGRTFGVKLWPTLVLLRDGHEVARVVRPRSDADLRTAFRALG
ncbi:MAG: thioredoxin family protein [Kofleriaceae bacterium]